MTLFWHGHFVSSWSDGIDSASHHMMRQNQLYRERALGNFVGSTQDMSLEPAMLRLPLERLQRRRARRTRTSPAS